MLPSRPQVQFLSEHFLKVRIVKCKVNWPCKLSLTCRLCKKKRKKEKNISGGSNFEKFNHFLAKWGRSGRFDFKVGKKSRQQFYLGVPATGTKRVPIFFNGNGTSFTQNGTETCPHRSQSVPRLPDCIHVKPVQRSSL